MKDYDGFNFDSFKKMAKDSTLSKYEKIGSPDMYRAGKEQLIFKDIITKVPNIFEKRNLTVLDIGSGCTDIPLMLSDLCKEQGHRLIYNDSQEMLDQLPNGDHIAKVAGKFPEVLNEIQKILLQTGGGGGRYYYQLQRFSLCFCRGKPLGIYRRDNVAAKQ